MGLFLHNGKLLVKDGKLAAHEDCCCPTYYCGVSEDDDIDAYFYDIVDCDDLLVCSGDCTSLNGNTYRCVHDAAGVWLYSDGGVGIAINCSGGKWYVAAGLDSDTYGCFSGNKTAAMPITIDNNQTDCTGQRCGYDGKVDLSVP